jgi:hypothetical protein
VLSLISVMREEWRFRHAAYTRPESFGSSIGPAVAETEPHRYARPIADFEESYDPRSSN